MPYSTINLLFKTLGMVIFLFLLLWPAIFFAAFMGMANGASVVEGSAVILGYGVINIGTLVMTEKLYKNGKIKIAIGWRLLLVAIPFSVFI